VEGGEEQMLKDYQREEWNRMVAEAERNLKSNCPLLEDEVIVAVGKIVTEKALDDMVRNAEELGLYEDKCKYKFAEVKFNNGRGALLCNKCRIIIDYGFDHEDTLHLCDKCKEELK
jgi:predicted Zn-dependent protease with MMP-like domain